jgi:FkbM family methyltransferase
MVLSQKVLHNNFLYPMLRHFRGAARKFGFEIRKAPFANFEAVPVFDLALNYLLATRGTELTFIEVGANDGEFNDPLREYIVKFRWRGVLIEPQPDVFERLKLNYAGQSDRLSFENVAISSNTAPLALYRLPDSFPLARAKFATAVASSNQEQTARLLHVKPHQLERVVVPTAQLDDIIVKHRLAGLHILQIDTEGLDWDVLQTLDLTKNRPLLIRYEHGHLSSQVISAMTQHLNEHGYLVNFGGLEADSIALRRDFIQA